MTRSIHWSVGRSVCHNFPEKRTFRFHAQAKQLFILESSRSAKSMMYVPVFPAGPLGWGHASPALVLLLGVLVAQPARKTTNIVADRASAHVTRHLCIRLVVAPKSNVLYFSL